MSENWKGWDRETPPFEGCFATEKGWETPLKGTAPADGLTEVVVTIGGLSETAGGPNIQSVAPLTTAGTFVETDEIEIEVVFNEIVDVTGAPRIALTLDSGTVYAEYDSGTGSNRLVFLYTVAASDLAATGITVVSPIELNGGTIVDQDDTPQNAVLTFSAPDMSAYIVDAVAPTILTVVSPEDATDIDTGGTFTINVTYDEAVDVTGTPQIPVFANDGTTPLAGNSGLADYVGGTGTTVISFQYTVDAGDNEATGVKIGADISLNGGTMEDAAGNDADLTFAQETTTITLNQP